MEFLKQGRSGKNKDYTHDQGSDDAPEEDFVLINGRDTKKGEYQDEDKDIVDTQSLFNHISCEEFKGFGFSKR